MPTRLIMVVAPAGFGKTTLVNEWIRTLDPAVPVGWLSLDERDVDPVRFWSYLAECVRRLGVSIDDRHLAELRANPRSAANLSASIARALERTGGKNIVVLDDVHRVDEVAVIDPILDLIEAARTTTFIIISRAPWPAAKARTLATALVLTADELAFTLDETRTILGQVRGDSVPDDEAIEAIHAETEGWPVLVRLAAEDSGRGSNPDRTAVDVVGASPTVAGYLTQEVLDRLPAHVREFLIELSVVDRYPLELAETLVGPKAKEMIEELSDHPLVGPADSGGWYGPHPVIRDLLRAHLKAAGPARERMLELRAGRWHRDQGSASRAVEHLVAGGAYDEVLEHIRDLALHYWAAGRADTVNRWFDLVPIEEIERRSDACASRAYLLVATGRFEEAEGWLVQAERVARTVLQRLGVVRVRLYLARGRGDPDDLLRQVAAFDALAVTVDDPDLIEAIRHMGAENTGLTALAHEYFGDDERCRALWARAKVNVTSPEVLLAYDHVSARRLADDGDLDRADALARSVLRRSGEFGIEPFHVSAHSEMALARIAWCRANLAEAEAILQRAARLDGGEAMLLRSNRRVLLAEVLASGGQHDRSQRLLEAARFGNNASPNPPTLRIWIAGWGLWISAVHQRTAAAQYWLKTVELLGGMERLSAPLSARAALVREQPEMVVDQFGADGSRLPSQPLPRLRCGLALEQALHLQGGSEKALAIAGDLLATAQQHHIVQPLIDEPAMVHRYRAANADLVARDLIDRVLTAVGSASEPMLLGQPGTPFAALTARELDVLRFLPTRMTNKEIAAELDVSLNTVKSHLRSIYRKLGAASRNDALDRCRELGLV